MESYAAACREAIDRALPEDASANYLLEPVREYLDRDGKGIRPALCLAACEAFGGTIDDGLPSAVALEMLHNAFLVHDDIEDESSMRRGGPTLHRRYGMPLAVNAGDALGLFGMAALRDNRPRLGAALADRILAEFEFMARQTVDGQSMDIGWRVDNRIDVAPQDYLTVIMKKTCWYTTILPLRVGALAGSRGTADIEPMIQFGFSLGAAFQIQDDILSLTAEDDVYGKEPLGDLYEGKRTLMMIHLLAAINDGDRSRLDRFLAAPRSARTAGDAVWILDQMHAYGSVGFAREFAHGVASAAVASFEAAFSSVRDSSARRFIRDLIPYMIERTR